MLTHAADVNRKRLSIRSKHEDSDAPSSTMPTFEGKPIDQLNSAEYARYLGLDARA